MYGKTQTVIIAYPVTLWTLFCLWHTLLGRWRQRLLTLYREKSWKIRAYMKKILRYGSLLKVFRIGASREPIETAGSCGPDRAWKALKQGAESRYEEQKHTDPDPTKSHAP